MSTITQEDVAIRNAVRTIVNEALTKIASDPEKYRPQAGDVLTDYAINHVSAEGGEVHQGSGDQDF